MSRNHIALQNRFLGRGDTVYDQLDRLHQARGRITDADVADLARELSLPVANVRAVAHFYDDLKPRTGATPKAVVRICNGEACLAAGGCKGRQALQAHPDVHVEEVTCLGHCDHAPNAVVEGSWPGSGPVPAELAAALDRPTTQVYGSADWLTSTFVGVDGSDLDAARARGAYRAFEHARVGDEVLLRSKPHPIIAEVEASQLRGRGGAGFPTGRKLRAVREAPSSTGERVIVINADEGDAGAFIDRLLLERAPHTVIEGTLLAALAVGATEGYVYLRGEYPFAWDVFTKAVSAARDAGLLGANALGQGRSFDLKMVRGHGAYVCGEETSLLRSLEGVPAQVSPKPPYPAEQGLRGLPTLVQNVETLACLPRIVAGGGEAYAAVGHGHSRGTKLVSLNSVVARPGLYEVPFGTTIRELIFDLAGGMAEGLTFQAVQVGGPLGGILSEAQLDLPLDFEALAAADAMLGHAGMVVFADDVDLVDVGRGLMRFCAVESCGKCFPCRLGSVRGTELFDKILRKEGTQSDLELLAELAETMELGSLCALGGGVPLPIRNLLTTFIDAFVPYVAGAGVPALLREEVS